MLQRQKEPHMFPPTQTHFNAASPEYKFIKHTWFYDSTLPCTYRHEQMNQVWLGRLK